MSNGGSRGGDGGSRKRNAPPESAVKDKLASIRARRAERAAARAAQPPGGAAAPDDDDGDEKTAAFNIEDFDLDAIAGRKPAPPRAAAPPPEEDDEEDEATAAFNLADFDVDAIVGRGKKPAPAEPPPRRAAPAPPPPRHDDDDDDDEKTAAFSLDDVSHLLSARGGRTPVAEQPTMPVRSSRAAAPPPPQHDDEEEKTAAFSLDDVSHLLPRGRQAAAPEPEPEPEEHERTAAIDLDAFMSSAPLPSKPAVLGEGDRTIAMEDDEEEDGRTMMVDSLPELPPRGGRGAAGRAPAPAELVVMVGSDIGKRYVLERDVTLVGRGLDADFVVNDASASRRHFNVVKTSTGWKLVDLGSGNGTKINGERVKEVALAHGMRIECGQTTLEFVSPDGGMAPAAAAPPAWEEDDEEDEDKTRLGDMAALEIDPDWEARRARMAQQAQQAQQPAHHQAPAPGPPPQRMAEPEAQPEPPPRTKRRGGAGKTVALAGGLMLLAGGGFVAADKIGGLGIIFDKGPAEVRPVEEEPTISDADRERARLLVAEGEVAYEEQRWHEARKLFREALAIDDAAQRDNGMPMLEAAAITEIQLEAWGKLVEARRALDAERFDAALAQLRGITSDTAYFAPAQELLASAQDGFVATQFHLARRAEQAEDYETAKRHIEQALEAVPEDPDATMFKTALTAATAPDADNLENEDNDLSQPAQDAKAPARDMARGFDLYAGGNFMGAIDFFDGIIHGRASRRDKAKARAIAGAITKFETVYRAGSDALEAGDAERALTNFRQARKFDSAVNSAFADAIAEGLSKGHTMLAETALAGDDLTAAGRHAKQALAADPENADARAVAERVASSAQGWVSAARSAADANPDRAMSLLAQALSALPEDHDVFKEALELLGGLLHFAD